MLDASFRGLFLQMEEAPPVRQLVKLRIRLPKAGGEARELVVHAVVVRVVDGQHGQPGVGLRFFALNGQDRSDWESFVAGLIRARTRAA
ncbi:hypothetical protein AKJ09_04788 [Labilithrix luteola]|uniref:PilZ domain-containing protein n=2 Tax=Labilithrix luteola TaxID=1391654 RepID=A0A0K1PYA5_9BACT|nr:hypothetical protein AKJ09_04788 [Labilithrix luteola]